MIMDMIKRGRPSTKPRSGFGQRLMQAREACGISQAELAEKLKVLQRTVSYWEHGSCTLRPEQIAQIASVLNVQVNVLLPEAPSAGRAKPGPPSKLQQKIEQISKLPLAKQQAILQVLDMALGAKA
jgi:transcriptional regulator with XRE-family HTH domain